MEEVLAGRGKGRGERNLFSVYGEYVHGETRVDGSLMYSTGIVPLCNHMNSIL